MCRECLELLETVLAGRPMPGWRAGDWRESERLGQPLTQRQKLAWVQTWLPMTAAVMDLSGAIAATEREPAQRG